MILINNKKKTSRINQEALINQTKMVDASLKFGPEWLRAITEPQEKQNVFKCVGMEYSAYFRIEEKLHILNGLFNAMLHDSKWKQILASISDSNALMGKLAAPI